MKKVTLIFFSLICLGIVSCDQKGGTEKAIYDSEDTSSIKVEQGPKVEGTTSMEFYEKEYDFGTIDEGIMASHTFKFKNTGNVPLVISDARADCGCTVPTWTKDPVLPGKEGEIEVKYNSNGKGGQTVSKTVTVFANTEPVENKLIIKAQVKEKNDGSPMAK